VKGKVVAILIALLCMALYFIQSTQKAERHRLASSTTYASTAAGMTIFREELEKLSSKRVEVFKQAVLYQSDLDRVGGYFLFAPKVPVSLRESQLMRQAVESGMTLVLSVFSPEGWERLAALRKEFGVGFRLEEWGEFEDKEPARVKVSQSQWPFIQDNIYAFYSQHVFKQDSCNHERLSLDCFVHSEQIGQGQIVIILGFPPVSNGLLRFSDNAMIVPELSMIPGKLIIDEYHHLHSELGFGDLLKEANFIFPILFLLVGVALFLFFGEISPLQRDQKRRTIPMEDFHRFTQNILQGVNDTAAGRHSLLSYHLRILRKAFPDKQSALSGIIVGSTLSRSDFIKLAKVLCRLEYEFLNERKGLNAIRKS